MAQGIGCGDVAACLAYRNDQLDLMLKIFGPRRVRYRGAGLDDRVGRFHEKDRCVPLRIVAHFAGVCGIIAANTVDPVHGKRLVSSGDRDGRLGYFKQVHP
jgi:hypothetical protein